LGKISEKSDSSKAIHDNGPSENQSSSSRIFFGWWIVAAGTVTSVLHTVVYNLGASTIFLPVANEFGTSRTVISGAFALSRLEGGLAGPIEGFLIHWIGPRRYIIAGWIIFGFGLIGIGLSETVLQFYLAFLLATLGQMTSGFLPIMTVLVNWFDRKRGKAIALFQIGMSVGALFITGFAWLVLNIGWRQTMIGSGVFVMLVGVPLSALMRYRPEDYGYAPDGASLTRNSAPTAENDELSSSKKGSNPSVRQVYSESGVLAASKALRQSIVHSETWHIFRSRGFWMLGTAHSASLAGWGALRVHMIPALVDSGLSEQVAASMLAFSMVVSGGGRLIGGFLGDMIGAKKLLVTAFLAQAFSVVLFALASSFIFSGVAALIFGVAFGARGTLLIMLRGEIFGRDSFARLSGLMDLLTMFGVVIAPMFAAIAYDTLGNYSVAFLVIAGLNASGAFLLFYIDLPERTAAVAGSSNG
tara:strand:+ start:14567 stop:15982 length:1416 start_codon:yes stop_codon:yes gene_type:complete